MLFRRSIGRLWLAAFGWQVAGGAPGVRRAVVLAYPHTSNWDLLFTLAISYTLDLRIRWLGKQSLFRAPYGWWMRFVGGIPVERSSKHRLVDAIVESVAGQQDALVLISPEGTRSRAARWKSGFYWVAVGAEMPIVLGFLDFGRKRGGLGEVLWPSGDISADLDKIRAFYHGVQGKIPELQGEIRLDPLDAVEPEQR